MADPEELKELSEDDLFDNAVGEAPAEAAAETAGEVVEQVGQPRDKETGQWTGKPEAEPEAQAEQTDERPPKPPKPEWRYEEDAARARAAEAELANERAEKAALRQRLEALERPKPEPAAEKAATPDPLLDPDGYKAAIREEIRQERLAEVREESLQRAREANQKEFDEAYTAARQAVDPALRVRMQAARDPGKVLLEWHRENKTRQEIGGDLNAYKQRLLDESLKDPAFLAKAVEAARGSAQPSQANGRPRVELPPSLNSASRSNAALRSAMTADVDDDALFDQTTA